MKTQVGRALAQLGIRQHRGRGARAFPSAPLQALQDRLPRSWRWPGSLTAAAANRWSAEWIGRPIMPPSR